MDIEQLYVVLNSLFYLTAFIYLYIKSKNFNTGVFLLSIWAVSSLSAINYINAPIPYSSSHTVTLIPFIYLSVLIMISFIPILKFRSDRLNGISYNKHAVFILSAIIVILNFVPFIENIVYLLKTLLTNSSQFAENYSLIYEMDEKIQYYSWLSQKFISFAQYFNGTVPILLFLNLLMIRKNKFFIIGLCFAFLNPIINNIILGNRFVLVTKILLLVFLFLLFKRFFTNEQKKKIILYSSAMLTLAIVLIGSITYYRFAEMSTDLNIFDWITVYSGESFLNFNRDMWYVQNLTHGDNSFYYYRYLLDLFEFPQRKFELLGSITGLRMYVYYTFIGDFFVDFGKLLTPLFVLISVGVVWKLTSFKNIASFSKLYFLIFYAPICITGFTFFTYQNYQNETIFTILIGILFLFIKNDSQILPKIE